MDIKEYLSNPCGMLSIPYWKYKTLDIPSSVTIIHERDWKNQSHNYQRFFRVKHNLDNLPIVDFDFELLNIDNQAEELAAMVNSCYKDEGITLNEQDILSWRNHKTFREYLCVYIKDNNGLMIASGIAEFDQECKEGTIEWVQVLPEYRRKGIASAITSRLAVEIMNRGKIPFYCTAWSNIRSVRNAVKSGFIPAWAEMTIKTKEFVEEAIKDKEVEENDN